MTKKKATEKELLHQLIDKMSKTERKLPSDEAREVWNKTDEETKLAICLYVMERIWEHAVEGGSYRTLIYDRLGFDLCAYSYLYPVGMNISNEFEVREKQEADHD